MAAFHVWEESDEK